MLRPLATTHDLPAGPPPEVRRQVAVAWERALELFESVEVDFMSDALTGRVFAVLRDADGSVRRLSASEALALAA